MPMAAALAPSIPRNGPLILRAPSYVVSASRLIAPRATMKRIACERTASCPEDLDLERALATFPSQAIQPPLQRLRRLNLDRVASHFQRHRIVVFAPLVIFRQFLECRAAPGIAARSKIREQRKRRLLAPHFL